MRLLLFSIIMSIAMPVLAIGGESGLITDPVGQRKVYSQSSLLAIGHKVFTAESYGQRCEIVWGDNSDVYFLNPIALSQISNDYYIKGELKDSRVEVTFPQIISDTGKLDKYIWVMRLDEATSKLVKYEQSQTAVFNVDTAGVLTLEDESLFLGVADADGNWLGEYFEEGMASAAASIVYYPVDVNAVNPPSDAKVERWWMTSIMPGAVEHNVNVNVAVTDKEFYIQGVSVQYPEAWIKGNIEFDGSAYSVSFPQQQFVGFGNTGNELSFFFGYTYTERFNEETYEYVQENMALWATDKPIVLSYNPQEKTLVANEGEGFAINNGVGVDNRYESFGHLSFSRNGTIFVAEVPWGVSQMAMTFKVIDEDGKKCQVGNGHIPCDYEDYRGQAIDNIYSGEIVVPSTVNGYSVVRVGYGAFEEMRNITSVVLPDAVEQIDDYAFSMDQKLTKFTFPASLKVIGEGAFRSTGLSDINLQGITELGIAVFLANNNITEVTWPGHLTVMPESTFEECVNLKKIVFEDGIKSIDRSALAFCYDLSEIDMSRVTTLETIGKYAFCRTSVKDLTLPASVTTIRQGVFLSMFDLLSLTALGEVPATIEPERIETTGTFDSVSSQAVLYVPKGCVEAYSAADGWKEFLQKGGIKEIGEAGVELPEIDAETSEDADWYTIDGRRLPSRPSQSGVYIHGKKKVFINN